MTFRSVKLNETEAMNEAEYFKFESLFCYAKNIWDRKSKQKLKQIPIILNA